VTGGWCRIARRGWDSDLELRAIEVATVVFCIAKLALDLNTHSNLTMAPIELDDYGPSSAVAASSTSGTGEVDPTSDPLLRHARFASDIDEDMDVDGGNQTSNNSGYSSWRRSAGRRRSGSTNSGTFRGNSRRFPLMLVGIIGIPVLLLSLIYGIIRGNAPDLLPDLHLTDILAPIKLTESLSRRCVCGTDEGKRDTEGKRVCGVYGKDGLLRSRLHEGTGNRIKDFVRFARTGKRLKVGIMGGSGEFRGFLGPSLDSSHEIRPACHFHAIVSACHGLHLKPGFPGGDPAGPGCYPTLFVDWLHKAFPMASPVLPRHLSIDTSISDRSLILWCDVRSLMDRNTKSSTVLSEPWIARITLSAE
jgi:hypothetical protein